MPPSVSVVPTGTFRLLQGVRVPGLSKRNVRIYLPSGYEPSQQRPSLWMFDGQNIFGDEGSFSRGWHVHDAVDRFGRGRVAPVVVGIDHGGEARIDELSPFRDGKQGGKCDALLDWMVVTLMPRLRRELGVTAGPKDVIIGGSSMGGLAAMYAHFKHPAAFGGALCMSPAFWFAKKAVLGFVEGQPIPWTSRIYVDCGVREGAGAMFAVVEEMVAQLVARGYADDRLMWRPDPRGSHNEANWRRRLPKALRFLLP